MHRQVETKVAVQRGSTKSDSYLLLSTAVADLPEGPRILVCLEDITARKLAELELREALREVERLKEQLQLENLCLRQEIKQTHGFEEIVGKSRPLQHTLESIELVASTNSSVLILGETGTGKELIARAIYKRSSRKDSPWSPSTAPPCQPACSRVNSLGTPPELLPVPRRTNRDVLNWPIKGRFFSTKSPNCRSNCRRSYFA